VDVPVYHEILFAVFLVQSGVLLSHAYTF
jgi:hypothetical protein